MKITEPYAKIIIINGQAFDLPGWESVGENTLRLIEMCGRVSHRSEELQTQDSWRRFIPAVVMQHGDWPWPCRSLPKQQR